MAWHLWDSRPWGVKPGPAPVPARGAALRTGLMADTLALVLAGGRGTRLGSLTARRAKPAVPIAGKYRIIDFTLSNCLNSGISQIGVLTQYMAHSLLPHLQSWNSSREVSIRALPARDGSEYLGTADAVYQNRDLIRTRMPAHVVVLAADHVYKMDYAAMLEAHLQRRAQVTVGCVEVPVEAAREFGVMAVDGHGRIRAFAEKPQCPQPIPGKPGRALASMGIYIFDTAFLLKALDEDAARQGSSRDFGKDVIPDAVARARVYAYRLHDLHRPEQDGYWRDVGTIDAYWRTNLELTGDASVLDLDDPAWPLLGGPMGGPVPHGSIVAEASVRRSVLFHGVRVGADSLIESSIILPGARVEGGCTIRNAIVDEGCHLPSGTVIGVNPEHDRRRYPITPAGVVLVSG
ncbi:MAG: sugar phosphate nucleotidyltransferase [Nevskia sp.]|nr:sugar phosphate nucleotidyltransferase [Nevskia sp.]